MAAICALQPSDAGSGWVQIPPRSKRKHWFLIVARRAGLGRAILLLAARDDLQRIVRQRSLQFECLRRVSQQPQIDLRWRRYNDWHGLWMDRGDNGIRFCREKAEQLMLTINGRALRPSNAAPRGPSTRELVPIL